MGERTKSETVLFNRLVSDCITFGLKTNEALKYIEIGLGKPVAYRSYNRRKAKLQSEHSSNLWLNYFTRIGFVQHHQKLIEDIRKIHDNSLHRYFEESLRPKEERNDELILKLKADIRANASLLSELGLGTPIISSIKQKLREQQNASITQRVPDGR